ncbi:sensor histidine kinase [Streptomyces sp. NPDC006274]|uniref:sensor histidine kinase n=1 Tax=unclassified Streptomyces TaxID=2593676 RepID=UPI0033B494D3
MKRSHTAPEREAAVPVDERWTQFYRYGPFALLALAVVVGGAVAGGFMSTGELYAAAVLAVAAAALQGWWALRPPDEGDQALPGRIYYVLRAVLAFGLTLLNPLFSVYAVAGYFDTGHLLPRRWVYPGLLFTALTMAGGQSGGLPPVSASQGILFGGLYVLNAALCVLFTRLGTHEAERAQQRVATIQALEDTNARLERALEENAGLHAQLLVQAREAGVADERGRLAAEIHDTIAQGLAGIITQLQVVTSTDDPDLAAQHLARASALARHSLGEARRSVQNLAPAALEHAALPEALKRTVAEWSERTGVRARFAVTGTEEGLHDEVAATLLRIAEEALANTARHAEATRAGVTLSFMGDELTLDVRDDGRGFDPSAVPPRSGSGGFGLNGMRARAERIAGTVTVESEPGQGTAVSARVPLVRHG